MKCMLFHKKIISNSCRNFFTSVLVFILLKKIQNLTEFYKSSRRQLCHSYHTFFFFFFLSYFFFVIAIILVELGTGCWTAKLLRFLIITFAQISGLSQFFSHRNLLSYARVFCDWPTWPLDDFAQKIFLCWPTLPNLHWIGLSLVNAGWIGNCQPFMSPRCITWFWNINFCCFHIYISDHLLGPTPSCCYCCSSISHDTEHN